MLTLPVLALLATAAGFGNAQTPVPTKSLYITWRYGEPLPNGPQVLVACGGGPIVGNTNGDLLSLAGTYWRYCNPSWDLDIRAPTTAISFGNTPSGAANFCLDATLYPGNGIRPHIWQCYDGAPQQTWKVHCDGSIELAGKNLCLDVTDGNGNNTIQLWECTGGPNQQWVFHDTPPA